MTRALALATALLLASLSHVPTAQAADPVYFWDLQPRSLRLLVSSPQVMVTRTKSGWEAYCHCPVVLAPSEIPEVMKKAIVAVEDKRYFEHSGVDVVSLLSVLKGGLTRGGSTIPMQLLKNLVFHDLRASDVITRLERKMGEATAQDESREAPEHPAVLDVRAAAEIGDDDDRDRHIGQLDHQIRGHMEGNPVPAPAAQSNEKFIRAQEQVPAQRIVMAAG